MARRNNVDQLAQAFTTNPVDAAAYDDRDTAETDALFSALSQVKKGHIPTNSIVPRDSGVMEIAGWKITPVGLIPPSDVNEAEYQNVGRALLRLDTSMQWLIGDWVVLGDNFKWGETYQMLADELGYEVATLKDYAYVARNVSSSVRTDGLSFGHHKIVTAMDEQEQRHWLEKAATDGLSIAKMRKAIKAAQLPPPPPQPPAPSKTTEPQFAVGDRVRIIHLGRTGRVKIVEPRMITMIDDMTRNEERWGYSMLEVIDSDEPPTQTIEPGAVVQTRTGHYGTVENVSGQLATIRTPNGTSKHKVNTLAPVEEIDEADTFAPAADPPTQNEPGGFSHDAYRQADEAWHGARKALEDVRVLHMSGVSQGQPLSRSNREKARQQIRDLIAHLHYIESQLEA